MMGCSNRNSGPECQEALSSSRSPPSNGTPGPEGQVIELVEKYREVDSLSPVLHEPLNKPDQIALFFQVLEHHLSLIKSRSQAFEDGHVTVYDKALLSLTQNGSDMHNMGALELYLDEVIGIRHGDNIEKMQLVLDRHIQLKVLLGQVSTSKAKQHGPENPAPTNGEGKVNTQGTKLRIYPYRHPSRGEDKLSRILAVYAKAKADFFAIDETSTGEKSCAAKFLRDTAENTLVYIRAQKTDHRLIPELQSTFEMAKEKAITLSGGRKRRFEICEMESADDIPRNPKRAVPRNHYRHSRSQNGHSVGRPWGFYEGGASRYPDGRRKADCYRP